MLGCFGMGQGCGLGLERAGDDPHDAREGKEMGTDWARSE